MEHDPQQKDRLKTILRIPVRDWVYLLCILVLSLAAYPLILMVQWLVRPFDYFKNLMDFSTSHQNALTVLLLSGLVAWLCLLSWRIQHPAMRICFTFAAAIFASLFVLMIPAFNFIGMAKDLFRWSGGSDIYYDQFSYLSAVWLTTEATKGYGLVRTQLWGMNIQFVLNWLSFIVLAVTIYAMLMLPRMKQIRARVLLLLAIQLLLMMLFLVPLYYTVLESYWGWTPERQLYEMHQIHSFGLTPEVFLEQGLIWYIAAHSHLLLFACLILGMLFVRYVLKDWPLVSEHQDHGLPEEDELSVGEIH